jgi:hypothetical protein
MFASNRKPIKLIIDEQLNHQPALLTALVSISYAKKKKKRLKTHDSITGQRMKMVCRTCPL